MHIRLTAVAVSSEALRAGLSFSLVNDIMEIANHRSRLRHLTVEPELLTTMTFTTPYRLAIGKGTVINRKVSEYSF